MNRILILVSAISSAAYAQTACEQLQSLKLADTTITMATTVPAGAFVNPGPPPAPQSADDFLSYPRPCMPTATIGQHDAFQSWQ